MAIAAPVRLPKPGEVRAEAALTLVAIATPVAVLSCGGLVVAPPMATVGGMGFDLAAKKVLGSLSCGNQKRSWP